MASSSSLISSLCSPTTLSLDAFPRTRRTSNQKRNLSKTYVIRRTDHQDHDHNHDQDSKNRSFFNRSLVDEDMIVLRQRIHEAKMSEEGYEPPVEWMDWERRLYAHNHYSSLICDALLQLQSCLMETRPSFVLGMVVFLALCVPASVAVVFYGLLVRGIF